MQYQEFLQEIRTRELFDIVGQLPSELRTRSLTLRGAV